MAHNPEVYEYTDLVVSELLSKAQLVCFHVESHVGGEYLEVAMFVWKILNDEYDRCLDTLLDKKGELGW